MDYYWLLLIILIAIDDWFSLIDIAEQNKSLENQLCFQQSEILNWLFTRILIPFGWLKGAPNVTQLLRFSVLVSWLDSINLMSCFAWSIWVYACNTRATISNEVNWYHSTLCNSGNHLLLMLFDLGPLS